MSRPPATKPTLRDISSALAAEEATLRKVSKAATERAHKLNRLTARERIARLLGTLRATIDERARMSVCVLVNKALP